MLFETIKQRSIHPGYLIFLNNENKFEIIRHLNIIAVRAKRYFAIVLSIEISITLIKQFIQALIYCIKISEDETYSLFNTVYYFVNCIKYSICIYFVWKISSNNCFYLFLILMKILFDKFNSLLYIFCNNHKMTRNKLRILFFFEMINYVRFGIFKVMIGVA